METTQKRKKTRRHLSSFQIIIMGFAAAILVGSLLLMLPIATIDRQGACFEDALFTATSAMCVTGLIVQDTATYWSYFGQAVIISLIQVGGLGVITLAMAITTISGRKIGIMQRNTMQEAISAPPYGRNCPADRIYPEGYSLHGADLRSHHVPCLLPGVRPGEGDLVLHFPFHIGILQRWI